MKSSIKHLGAAIAFAIAGMSAAYAAPVGKPMGYAERIYSDYAAAAGDTIRFDVETTYTGSMQELAGQPFLKVIGMPEYVITSNLNGLAFDDVRYTQVSPKLAEYADLVGTVEGYNDVGYPVAEGKFRHLTVIATVGKDARIHQALEFCWATLNHCVMIDPSIEFLDSMVNERTRAIAEGWGPRVHLLKRPADEKATGCTLASDTTAYGKHYNYNARTWSAKNGFGITVVTHQLGAQQAGLRCDYYCNIAPYGYSKSSSSTGSMGWDTTCGNKFNAGVTGRTGKWIAETKCTHTFTGEAKAQVEWKGTGSGVGLSWSLNGGVQSVGGQYLDTCGNF